MTELTRGIICGRTVNLLHTQIGRMELASRRVALMRIVRRAEDGTTDIIGLCQIVRTAGISLANQVTLFIVIS